MTPRHTSLQTLFLLLGSFLTTAFSTVASERRPNILFLFADDMRPDAIRALGNERIETPHLDSLVANGTTFLKATCSNPICVVSRAEVLTGRHGWENGVNGMDRPQLNPTNSYWAETFRKAGYATTYVGKWHTAGRPSAAGFESVEGLFSSGGGKYWKEGQIDWKGFPVTGYRGWLFQNADGREKYPELGVGVTPDISEKFADAAIRVIESQTDKPWFCQVNFTAPHDPLFLPPGYDKKYSVEDMKLPENFLPVHPFDHGNFDGRDEALLSWPRTPEAVCDLLRVYYSVIDDMDAQIGRILAALDASGQRSHTLVIFASDHGMACGSHGLRGKQNQYEHTINVPLILSGPGIPRDVRTEAQVYLRELYPTTCELAAVPVPKSVTARSFAEVARGNSDIHHETIFGYFTDTQRMVRRDDGWKLIVYPQAKISQLFNLNTDPFEQTNLIESTNTATSQIKSELMDELIEWQKQTGDPILDR